MDSLFVPAGFQGIVVQLRGFIELVLVAGQTRYSSAYRCWNLPNYRRRVIGFGVDVQWIVVGFSVWEIPSSC